MNYSIKMHTTAALRIINTFSVETNYKNRIAGEQIKLTELNSVCGICCCHCCRTIAQRGLVAGIFGRYWLCCLYLHISYDVSLCFVGLLARNLNSKIRVKVRRALGATKARLKLFYGIVGPLPSNGWPMV